MNTAVDYTTLMSQTRARIERSSREASLRSTLGGLPAVEQWRPFRRHLVTLAGVVEIQHGPVAVSASGDLPRAA
jgi:hypothetical protein